MDNPGNDFIRRAIAEYVEEHYDFDSVRILSINKSTDGSKFDVKAQLIYSPETIDNLVGNAADEEKDATRAFLSDGVFDVMFVVDNNGHVLDADWEDIQFST